MIYKVTIEIYVHANSKTDAEKNVVSALAPYDKILCITPLKVSFMHAYE